MKTVGSFEAKTHLARLLDEVAEGESYTITKHGRPVALLIPVTGPPRRPIAETIRELREFRRQHPLRGLSVRDLIDEGRRL